MRFNPLWTANHGLPTSVADPDPEPDRPMRPAEHPVYPGEIRTRSIGASGSIFGKTAVMVEHVWPGEPVKTTAAWMPVSREMLEDKGANFEGTFNSRIRRLLFPWEFPDPRVMPQFEFFPRLAAVVLIKRRVVGWVHERQRRVVSAWRVLRAGDDGRDDWY